MLIVLQEISFYFFFLYQQISTSIEASKSTHLTKVPAVSAVVPLDKELAYGHIWLEISGKGAPLGPICEPISGPVPTPGYKDIISGHIEI